MPVHARFAGDTANTPITTNSTSGSSFAAVATSTSRAPICTPRVFTQMSSAHTAAMIIARDAPTPAPGSSALTAFVKPSAMAACACTPSSHNSTPLRYPTNGPNTRPT